MLRPCALLAGLLLFLLPHAARADLKLCNRTSYVLEAATSTVKNTDSVTQGWLRLAPGDCATALKGSLSSGSYLVYARSALAHAGPPRAWGGAFPVCVKDGDFTLHQAVTQPYCTSADTFSLPFAPVKMKGVKRDWTMAFDETPAFPSLSMAQLAGVKRLLSDNGYKVGTIDGAPSKPTEAALADFRKKMKFTTNDNAVLFTALEKQADGKSAPQGYAVCNDSSGPLLAAIAQTGPGKPSARGWWRIGAKSCAQLLTTPLSGPIYLLAQKPEGPVVVGGGDKFCTTALAFEVEGRGDCTARGLIEAGFAVTAGGGRTGFVAHVGDKGLVR